MDTRTAVLRVQQLKERLTHTQDPKKIAKALKTLQALNISLDILVETGIGKTVNGFRKHYDVGDIARDLVHQWKKLVPDKEPLIDEKPKQKTDKVVPEKDCPMPKVKGHSVEKISSEYAKPSESTKKMEQHKNKKPDHPDKAVNDTKGHKSEKSQKEKDSRIVDCIERKVEKNLSSSSVDKKKKKSSDDKGKTFDETIQNQKGNAQNSTKESFDDKSNAKRTHEDSDTPTMSFESYLNYDQVSSKRKKRTCQSEPPKKVPICEQYYNAALVKAETSPTLTLPKGAEANLEMDEIPVNEVKKVCLADLLDVPLPKFLPDYTASPSPPHVTDNKANIPDTIEQRSEYSGFTGRRLNSKMLVYSGSKTIYLPKMVTLYAQCLRVLQNNIDSIQEVGGVPYDILLPVLDRCTPQQLSRIEEFNPAFIENSGPLWKKHCQWDFKGQGLLEYETWREMYFRLFSEREKKLKMITHSISSAHSGKPKGRQVKLAYVHGSAKAPLYIRRKQEINGTAGPIVQPPPTDKFKALKSDKDKVIAANSQNGSTNACVINSSNNMSGQGQDSKKTVKRIAPMMAKSMRAFRNRVGPR